MKRPAVFFDRDNTLIACDGYLGDPAKVELIEGAADSIVRVRDMGFAAVVFSNQSGVARGMFPEEAVHAVNHRLDELLHEEDPQAIIDRHDFCPYHPGAKVAKYRVDSDLRKPKPGMIYRAEQVLNLDLSRSWVVGDAPRDIAAGHAAGLRTVLLKIANLPPSPATNEGAGVEPDFVAGSLKEAVDFIAKQSKPVDRPAAAPAEAGANGHAAWPADEAANEPNPASVREPSALPEDPAAPEPAVPPPDNPAVSDEAAETALPMTSEAAAEDASAEADVETVPAEPAAEVPVADVAEPATAEPVKPTPADERPAEVEPAAQPDVVDDAWTIGRNRPATDPAAAAVEPTPAPDQAAAPSRPVESEPTPAAPEVAAAAAAESDADGALAARAASVAAAATDEPASAVSDPTEGPVKLTPRPNEPAKQPEPAAKPPQGGVVVKPNQAPGITWGERMRLAKQGGTTAVPTNPSKPAAAPAAATQPAANAPAASRPAVEPTPQPPATPAAPAPARPVVARPVVTTARPAARVAEPVVEADPVIDVEPEPPAAPAAEQVRAEPLRGVRREDAEALPAEEARPARTIVRLAERDDSAEPSGRILIDNRDAAGGGTDMSRVEDLLEQVIAELRRREDRDANDFSVSKLLAGITQVLALAAMFFAYLNRGNSSDLQTMLLLAATLQTLTISLLIMGRQR